MPCQRCIEKRRNRMLQKQRELERKKMFLHQKQITPVTQNKKVKKK